MWTHINGQVKRPDTAPGTYEYRRKCEYRFQENDGALIKYSRELIPTTIAAAATTAALIFKSIMTVENPLKNTMHPFQSAKEYVSRQWAILVK